MRGSADEVPKPLVEIGGRPILWHVMSLYAGQGIARFVLLLGHGADQIRAFASRLDDDWSVECVDTGRDAPTGARLLAAADRLPPETFCLTYADGLADIDLRSLIAFHRSHAGAATMTVVRPNSPWGIARLSGDRVEAFAEKPRLESWVNGGFFVMEPRALAAIGEGDALERGPLAALARAGDLYAFRHEGFWDCMDTYKDTLVLNELWDSGAAPWREPALR